MPVLTVVSVVALILSALLAGLHLSGMSLNPVMRTLDGPTYLAVKQAADREFPKIAKPLMLASLTVTVVLAVTAAVLGHADVLVLGLAATAALLVTLLAILRGDLPINRAMASWTPSTLPGNWAAVRSAWEKSFAVRVVANAIAVAMLAVAVGVTG